MKVMTHPPEFYGLGYLYTFTDEASNGSFADYYNENVLETMPEGSYDFMGDVNNLIGCPLNGEWTFWAGDYWLQDNGVLFGWELLFDEDLYMVQEEYAPTLIIGAWDVDPTIISISDTFIEVQPPSEGIYTYRYEITDDFSCVHERFVDLTVLEPDCSVGINEFEKGKFQIYPNPSEGNFILEIDEAYSRYMVFNSLGAEIMNNSIYRSENSTIDLSKFPDGIYELVLQSEKGTSHSTTLIKR